MGPESKHGISRRISREAGWFAGTVVVRAAAVYAGIKIGENLSNSMMSKDLEMYSAVSAGLALTVPEAVVRNRRA